MKKVIIGIAPQKKTRERMFAMAKGTYKAKEHEPRIWFTSMKPVAALLSDNNRAMLRVIRDEQPESISALAVLTGIKLSSLSRTLKTMARYGIVELRQENNRTRPIFEATDIHIVIY